MDELFGHMLIKRLAKLFLFQDGNFDTAMEQLCKYWPTSPLYFQNIIRIFSLFEVNFSTITKYSSEFIVAFAEFTRNFEDLFLYTTLDKSDEDLNVVVAYSYLTMRCPLTEEGRNFFIDLLIDIKRKSVQSPPEDQRLAKQLPIVLTNVFRNLGKMKSPMRDDYFIFFVQNAADIPPCCINLVSTFPQLMEIAGRLKSSGTVTTELVTEIDKKLFLLLKTGEKENKFRTIEDQEKLFKALEKHFLPNFAYLLTKFPLEAVLRDIFITALDFEQPIDELFDKYPEAFEPEGPKLHAEAVHELWEF